MYTQIMSHMHQNRSGVDFSHLEPDRQAPMSLAHSTCCRATLLVRRTRSEHVLAPCIFNEFISTNACVWCATADAEFHEGKTQLPYYLLPSHFPPFSVFLFPSFCPYNPLFFFSFFSVPLPSPSFPFLAKMCL